jgi:hypothetical protein
MGIALGLLIAGLGCAAAWDRALLMGRRSVRALRLGDEDAVTLELANAEQVPMRVSPRRYVSAALVVLPGVASMRRTIVVTGTMVEPEAFRALRLWALWGRVPDAGARSSLTEAHRLERTIF